jgi:hypothetical protein
MPSKKLIICTFAAIVVGSALGAAVMHYVGSADHTTVEARGVHQHQEEHAKVPAHDERDAHNAPKAGDAHSKEQVVRLSEAEQREFGIEVGTAGPGKLLSGRKRSLQSKSILRRNKLWQQPGSSAALPNTSCMRWALSRRTWPSCPTAQMRHARSMP